MKKWDYVEMFVALENIHSTAKKMGQTGWELAVAIPNPRTEKCILIFKQEITDSPTDEKIDQLTRELDDDECARFVQ